MEMVRYKISNPEITMGTVNSAAAERIAVLIPCYNEALTIGQVVRDFRQELPDALVFVYDNNSTDGTAALPARLVRMSFGSAGKARAM